MEASLALSGGRGPPNAIGSGQRLVEAHTISRTKMRLVQRGQDSTWRVRHVGERHPGLFSLGARHASEVGLIPTYRTVYRLVRARTYVCDGQTRLHL